MLKYKNTRKVAVMEDEQAVVKYEDTLRISGIYVDNIKREVRVILHKGFINEDKTFSIMDVNPVLVQIADFPEEIKPIQRMEDGKIISEIQKLPARPLYTLLITPLDEHKTRWAGDFRHKDIEQMILDYNLLPDFEFEGIIAM